MERDNSRRNRITGVHDQAHLLRGQHEEVQGPIRQDCCLHSYTDAFEIMRDAQTAKLQGFTTGDGWFAFNLATNLRQV